MRTEPYLKPYLYYSDLYDKHTVERCRVTERIARENDNSNPRDKKYTKKQVARLNTSVGEFIIHFEAGERYLNKENVIREWMKKDEEKDRLYDNAEAPENIHCLTCRKLLKPTFKDLWSSLDKPDRVLFMYDCPNECMPRRAFFSDGEEWRTKPHMCPTCNLVLKHTTIETVKKVTIKYSCAKCKYVDTEEIVLGERKEEELDENFAIDRDRFCLTETEGQKYREEKYSMEQLKGVLEEFNKKDEARKEKLKENPKGFYLEGSGYSCAICGGHTQEGDTWYDSFGIKCLTCQWAVDKKEIPPSLATNKDSWYSDFDMKNRFNIKSPTLRAWVKKGILKERVVTNNGKGIHVHLYLVKDNKDFLPPKKLTDSRSTQTVKNGETWYSSAPWYHFGDPENDMKAYRIMDYLRFVKEEKPESETKTETSV